VYFHSCGGAILFLFIMDITTPSRAVVADVVTSYDKIDREDNNHGNAGLEAHSSSSKRVSTTVKKADVSEKYEGEDSLRPEVETTIALPAGTEEGASSVSNISASDSCIPTPTPIHNPLTASAGLCRCGCVPNFPSLFEMAERRARYRRDQENARLLT
jgi:hypothetical protein